MNFCGKLFIFPEKKNLFGEWCFFNLNTCESESESESESLVTTIWYSVLENLEERLKKSINT